MAKNPIDKFWKLRSLMDGAGYYEKIDGFNIGLIKWFDQYPQPQEQNEWIYVGPDPDITTVESGVAKGDRTKVENLFSSVLDQVSFGTQDYNRLRKFLIDLYSSHRSLVTFSTQASDPHSLSNSDLDELFRSFGYPYSSSLRGFDENPLEQKVQFFLDLVNLYKVKGTPQSLLDVLQYYGVTELDIYEFFLKRSDASTLFFEGKSVAGTTANPSLLKIPYSNLTSLDPHWMYTKQQILNLIQTNSINLPSKTPYLGVQPIVNVEGAEISILVRKVQDQYDIYNDTGTLPTADAEIEYIGEVRTLLELYLSTLYMFNKLYDIGAYSQNFICYDGTNTVAADILEEYDLITSRPTSRANQKIKLQEYYDLFTRPTISNFLQTKSDPSIYLNSIAPDIKIQLDNAGDVLDVLYSLMKDLATWVRNNIGFGFIDFGFILFGIEAFFSDLKNVTDFFKPYRSRLLLLESLQEKNRLFNSILVEDSLSLRSNLTFHDFMTGDSTPCCNSDVDSTSQILCESSESSKCQREFTVPVPSSMVWKGLWLNSIIYSVNDVIPDSNNNHYICIKAHTSSYTTKPPSGLGWTIYWKKISQIVCTDTTGATYYSRETYDCGSSFDYGAVVNGDVVIEAKDVYSDHLRCPSDSSAFVVSEILDIDSYENTSPIYFSAPLTSGATTATITFVDPQPDTNYSVGLSILNETSYLSIYDYVITNKRTDGFDIMLSGQTDSDDYYAMWVIDSTGTFGSTPLLENEDEKTIMLPNDCTGTNYSVFISLNNVVDSIPSVYGFDVINKQQDRFTIRFSGPMDSTNYQLDWSVCSSDPYGEYNIPTGVSSITIPLPASKPNDGYPLIVNLLAPDSTSSIYSLIVSDKTSTTFSVNFSSEIESSGYKLLWYLPQTRTVEIYNLDYYQTGGFRDFDEEGSFDCTHGFDLVKITVEDTISDYLLLEDDISRLLQESGYGIFL